MVRNVQGVSQGLGDVMIKTAKNVARIKIALAHQTHANLTFVNAEAKKNALKKPIHVRLANANVVKTRNANLQKLALLGNV
jgi:hypothetical protein